MNLIDDIICSYELRRSPMAESRFRVFKTVVETGSITKAAKRHAYSQPGVSHLID
ncbi:MAG: LysR family transcriptional regulator, partial [Firmicutes bacterium]|nr:LysR family transcriptional regulator [Bacillota bacterium]